MERGAAPAGEPRQLALGRPRWSAERRAGLRHWPVIPGDPGIGPNRKAGQRVRRSVSAPLGAPPPSHCAGRKNEKGEARPPSKNQAAGRRSVGWLVGCHGWFRNDRPALHVMALSVAAIHVLFTTHEDVDARAKPGHDEPERCQASTL